MNFRLANLQKFLQTAQGSQKPDSLRFQIHLFDTLDSTNRVLWELIDQGASEGTVAIALQQQCGRGQWGHQWRSEPGGLYLSVALCPTLKATDAYQLTLCSVWGIAQVLRQQEIPVQIKWPNDLILEQRKLGGILTETRIQNGYIHRAVVGIGLNWNNPVPDVGINLTTFLKQSDDPKIQSLEELGAIALIGLQQGYHQWQRDGMTTILPSYTALLSHLGQQVSLNGQCIHVVGITANGSLRVRPLLDDGHPEIGEDYLLEPGTIHLGYQPSLLGNKSSHPPDSSSVH